ncbi:MAG: heme-binding protein [Pseudomonadota bacterium]
MRILKIALAVLATAVAGFVGYWWFLTANLEQPTFTVIAEADDYELRRYDPFTVAETRVDGAFRNSGNVAFRRLAGYIFGRNTGSEEMAMTAPVITQGAPVGTTMEMTAPVISGPAEGGEGWTYQFVMERKFTLDTLPRPLDPAVQLREVPGRLMAARRFSGRWLEGHMREQEARLLDALRRDGVAVLGDVSLARYNDPFTPFFLRRNEVLVEVAAPNRVASTRSPAP